MTPLLRTESIIEKLVDGFQKLDNQSCDNRDLYRKAMEALVRATRTEQCRQINDDFEKCMPQKSK